MYQYYSENIKAEGILDTNGNNDHSFVCYIFEEIYGDVTACMSLLSKYYMIQNQHR